MRQETQLLSDQLQINLPQGDYKMTTPRFIPENSQPTEKLLKELRRLQRELNSPRLLTYIEGDQSEQEMSRQRERASKLARFNDILATLNKG